LFCSLADDAVKDKGKIGAVLPINLLRGKATQKLREFILDNYHIRYIVKSTKDLGFSEGCYFRDILVVLEKRLPKKEELTGVILLKKPLGELEPGDGFQLGKLIRSIPTGEDVIREDIEIAWFSREEFELDKTNLMKYVGLNNIESIKTINSFLKVVKNKAGDKLTRLSKETIKEGFHTSPAGLSELCFITNNLHESRVDRASLILDSITKKELIFYIKNSKYKFKVPQDDVLPALRTATAVNKIDLGGGHDYLLIKNFEGFETILKLSKWKSKKFNWGIVKNHVKGKMSYVAISNRFRPNSPNTHLIAFVSSKKFVPLDTFKIINTDSFDEVITLAISINSVISLSNLTLIREQTTGGYTHLKSEDLILFDVLEPERAMKALRSLFDKIRYEEFPSLMEQLSSQNKNRVMLDKEILVYLGLSKTEIEYWLPKIYRVLLNELTSGE
jgi:hypothetical protein